MNGNLKLISTYGWFGGEDNLDANLKSVSTFGWFVDVIVVVGRLKLPTFLTATIDNRLRARC